MRDEVQRVFDGYPDGVRDRMLALRALIYEVAEATDGVGPLEETLKWGQISYLNPAGTTLRLDTAKGSPDRLALYVHCQTSVVESLRWRYEGYLEFEKNRGIHLPPDDETGEAVRDCIRTALTYRLR